ncbi:MAG: DNA polymerase domain-containing protein [Candidatus Bathyarchaeia archaeon]
MHSNSSTTSAKRVKGWLFDVYPASPSEMAVWIISQNGERVRLTDRFQPRVYVSGKQEDIERLASQLYSNPAVAAWNFTYKYAKPGDNEKMRVLEFTIKDCRQVSAVTRAILRKGNYLQYEVYNCDLHGDRAYLFSRDLFPLALVEVETEKAGLRYTLLDSVESTDYTIPPLRVAKLEVEIAKTGKIASFKDPVARLQVTQDDKRLSIDSGDEADKLLQLAKAINALDPDIVLTSGGDSTLFPYLTHRASINNILGKFILSRDPVPFKPKTARGRTFYSYGRVFYKAPTTRLYGRVHIDQANTFILNEAGFEGLIEIARTCRVPLHTATRASIGSSMSSLQFYQALKDEILIPRNKSIPEAFKSAYELLVGDRGGFVYEPQVGIHEDVGEVDFSSMYPMLMVKYNISAETVLCRCCPDSHLRIPELDYHVCEKRRGLVPKALQLVVSKRLHYKRKRLEIQDFKLREIYDKRQVALKWILVTCFGYLGYRNAKFGTVDGHMGVCAFGRDAFLRAARMAEEWGFTVVHGIVDSLWLKKENASVEEYNALCRAVSEEIGVPLNFEGRYKWIVFLPSKLHPRIGVLNRYYGVMEDGRIKVRGIELRRRDTPRFVYNAQEEMIRVLAAAEDAAEFMRQIPEALKVVAAYRQKLLDGDVPLCDLIVTKRLSKHPRRYRQKVSQVIAAEQLIREGAEVYAGKNVRFLFTSSESKRYERRVIAEQLIEKGVNPDVRKYLLLLYASAANLLCFAGYTSRTVYNMIRQLQTAKITEFL